MKKELVVPIVRLEGSYKQIGKAQANQGQWSLFEQQMDWYKSMARHSDASEAIHLLGTYAPFLVEEITGLADQLDMSLQQGVQIFSGYDMPFPEMGCSAFIHNSFYARNYDFSPDLYDGRLVIMKPENGFASVGFSHQLVGRLDGMNEKGLVVGLHFVNDVPSKKGFLAPTLVRMVLDQCATTAEAIDLLRKVPHGYCYNFSILDKMGEKGVVEAAPDHVAIRRGETLACTNHFQSNNLKAKNRTNITGSQQRIIALEDFRQYDPPLEEAFRLLNHHASPLFSRDYDQFFGTLHTVVYCPDDQSVLVGIGEDTDPILITFKKEERFPRCAKGYLEYNVEK
ncbi:C45 family peptidase [Radiobacillus kanasensis]|uniref:C45 family autoproteolytic acyltransferase/hydolase n=1 Tax=Radiobacillus kanasensis TaxID=2844358 RepID=UPI001E3B2DF9|nr:C45 family peptidase [Radiobacillus kanasensis]UFT99242.1 C45 family peptidase [Radiobacillus kanasensis]